MHVPAAVWRLSQAISFDTSKGAIDLEPASLEKYTLWVLGLNAALTVAQNPQTLKELPVPQMLWHPELYVMSDADVMSTV